MGSSPKQSATLGQFMYGYDRSLIEVKAYLKRHKEHGILFYPDDSLALLNAEDEFELYMALRPILSCDNAFPVKYGRYRHFQDKRDRIKWLKERFEAYYEVPATAKAESFFVDLKRRPTEEFIWYYNVPKIGSQS